MKLVPSLAEAMRKIRKASPCRHARIVPRAGLAHELSDFPYTPMQRRLTVPGQDAGQSSLAMEATMHREQGAVLEQL